MPGAISITISRSESDNRGRYDAQVEGREGSGELTYTRPSPDRLVAYHTGVDKSLRGNGVGKALVVRLVEDARAEGRTIVPQCPFIKALYDENPDWADVMDR